MGLLELKARFDVVTREPALQKLRPLQLAKYNDAKGRFEKEYADGRGKEDKCAEALQNLETVIARLTSTGAPTPTTATGGATTVSSPPSRMTAPVVEHAVEETEVLVTPERRGWIRSLTGGPPVVAATSVVSETTGDTPPSGRGTGGSASGGSSRSGSVSGGSASGRPTRLGVEEPGEETEDEDDAVRAEVEALHKEARPMMKTLGNAPALIQAVDDSVKGLDVVRLRDLVGQMKKKLAQMKGHADQQEKERAGRLDEASKIGAAAKASREAAAKAEADRLENERREKQRLADAARKAEEDLAAKKREEDAARQAEVTRQAEAPRLAQEAAAKKKADEAQQAEEAAAKKAQEDAAKKAEEIAAKKAEQKALLDKMTKHVEEAKGLLASLPKPDRAPFIGRIKAGVETKNAGELGNIVAEIKAAIAEAEKAAAAAKKAEEDRLERERLAEEARVENERLAEVARVEAARQAEEERLAEVARLEAARRAEEARLAELARVEAARQAEEERLAELARQEAARLAAEEAARVEAARVAAAEEAARVEAARVEAARVAAAEEAARLEAARLAASSPDATAKIKKLNLSDKDKELLEAVKARPVISAGATKGLAAIGGMIAEAEVKAEQARVDARGKIRTAETKSAKADEDMAKVAGEAARADEAVAKAGDEIAEAQNAAAGADAKKKAALKKKFDAYKAAFRAFAQEVIATGRYEKASIETSVANTIKSADNNFVSNNGKNPQWGFESVEEAWERYKGLLGKPAAAEALLTKAKEDHTSEKNTAAAEKTAAEEAERLAVGRKTTADEQKRVADEKKREADAKKLEAESEKSSAESELNNAGNLVVEAEAKAKVAAARLTTALRYGPAARTTVAPTTVSGLSADQLAERQKKAASRDKATAAVLENFKDNPDVADAALEAIRDSEHPEAFEGGVGKLCAIATGNFKGQATAREARTMAKNAIKMAGAVGGDYLARMDAYYAGDAASQPDPQRDPDDQKSALNYTGAMGGAMLADDGSVKTDPAAFEAIRANLNFHPGSLKKPLTNLVQHVETFRQKVSNEQIATTMRGVTRQPAGNSKGLVQKTLGLPPTGVVGVKEARQAILSAALTPLTQGPVGSCFATCNCMDYQEKDPAGFMADLGEMVKTGTLTKSGQTAPVVKNIPAGENGLLRGFEYTAATLGGQSAQSSRKKDIQRRVGNGFIEVAANPAFQKLNADKKLAERKLATARTELTTAQSDHSAAIRAYNDAIDVVDAAQAAYVTAHGKDPASADTKNKLRIRDLRQADVDALRLEKDGKQAIKLMKQTKVAAAEANVTLADSMWPARKEALKVAASAAITWEYDSEMAHSSTTPSADGSSSKGGWVMKKAADNSPITNDAQLQACLKDAFKGVLGAAVSDRDVEDVVALPGFMADVKVAPSGGGNIFRDEGGGQEADSKAVLTGKENEKHPMIGATGGTINERAKGLLTSIADGLKDTPEDTVAVGVSGVHSERALPRHPSLDALKSGPGDVTTKINAVFAETAAKATRPMDEDHMKHLFAKSGSTFLKDWMGDEAETMVSGNTAPAGALKPAELKQKIYDSVEARISARFSPADVALKMLKSKIDAFLLNELFPQFVVADTNWGDATGKIFHVIAPDLETGEPKLYKKDERSGEMEPADDKYVNANWDACKDKPPVTPTTA